MVGGVVIGSTQVRQLKKHLVNNKPSLKSRKYKRSVERCCSIGYHGYATPLNFLLADQPLSFVLGVQLRIDLEFKNKLCKSLKTSKIFYLKPFISFIHWYKWLQVNKLTCRTVDPLLMTVHFKTSVCPWRTTHVRRVAWHTKQNSFIMCSVKASVQLSIIFSNSQDLTSIV